MAIKIPHAKVFNNQDTESLHHYTTTNSSSTGTQNVIFCTGNNYTPEIIRNPNGAFPCFYCPESHITTPLRFVPLYRRESDHKIVWSPIAHCSLPCVYGTILSERTNNYNQIGLFHELFPGVPKPPPRFVFYVPDINATTPSMSIPEYKEFCKRNDEVWVEESVDCHTAFSPVCVTRSLKEKPSNNKTVAEYPSYHFYDIGQQEQKHPSELSSLHSTSDIHNTLPTKKNKTS